MFEVIVHGPGVFKRQTFDKPEIVVGSSRSNDLPLRHKHVSRQHARILYNDGFHVEDLGSKNGTKVNGVRVEGCVALRSIDDIDIGPFTLTLVPLNPLGDGSQDADIEAARPVTPAEESFLSSIRAYPGVPGARIAYADWLSKQGESLKAQILLTQESMRTAPPTQGQFRDLNALLARLPRGDMWWRVLIARAPIESCGAQYEGVCPKTWDGLRPTDKASMRTCGACGRDVLYCITIDEARDYAKKGGRVVIDAEVRRAPNDLRPRPPMPSSRR
jgi:uncharacterized protein (TIGR02996 family)